MAYYGTAGEAKRSASDTFTTASKRTTAADYKSVTSDYKPVQGFSPAAEATQKVNYGHPTLK